MIKGRQYAAIKNDAALMIQIEAHIARNGAKPVRIFHNLGFEPAMRADLRIPMERVDWILAGSFIAVMEDLK